MMKFLDTNGVLDWISNMEKLFEFENTLDNKKMKIVVTRLKGYASLHWKHLQIDRKMRGKEKIKMTKDLCEYCLWNIQNLL